jgi:uncharacterized protein YecE (DUF72 family)
MSTADHPRRSLWRVGTSGYSFSDWVGTFYPPGTRKQDMFEQYVQQFQTVEVNYTYYRMPAVKTMAGLDRRSPPGFDFWIKANRQLTHEGQLEPAAAFLDALDPLRSAGKLAGVLVQFPQSFHRTVGNRKYLAGLLESLAAVPVAVEFRHFSWDHHSTYAGLGDRGVTLVIPDVPEIASLHRPAPRLTSPTGYLRLHSRNADLWYAGAAERYDYDYSRDEMRELLAEWASLEEDADHVYAFFNNCHRGQAASNAETFERILGEMDTGGAGP